jgi:hypothetical protein
VESADRVLFPGVRPSPAAAMSAHTNAQELTNHSPTIHITRTPYFAGATMFVTAFVTTLVPAAGAFVPVLESESLFFLSISIS